MKKRYLLKIIFGICCLFIVVGCRVNTEENKSEKQKEIVQKREEEDYVEPYIDDNPIIVGTYFYQSGNRKLVNHYDTKFLQYQDIVSFEVFYSNEANLISGNFKNVWNYYYGLYQDIDKYKIGYHVRFDTKNGRIDQNILAPNDVMNFFDYLQIYLYDDIHQDGGWYSHVTQEEMNNDTRFTSIKFTGSTKIDEIVGDIVLDVFTYDEDDFDVDGNYRGKSKYQVVIKNV